MTAPRNQCQPVNASDEALAIAAVIDPVAFHPISLGDTHPGWQHRRETATDTANKILALRAGPSDIERAFTDACDEAGCAYDNEALLQAISDLKARPNCGVQTRDDVIEQCAKVAEAQAILFLSPEYAANQPFGSFCERFACEEVAKAIRSLAVSSADRASPTTSCRFPDCDCALDGSFCEVAKGFAVPSTHRGSES